MVLRYQQAWLDEDGYEHCFFTVWVDESYEAET